MPATPKPDHPDTPIWFAVLRSHSKALRAAGVTLWSVQPVVKAPPRERR